MTDAELLRTAVERAGSLKALADVLTMPDRVTLWRWQRSGTIPKDRDRALLAEYVGLHEHVCACGERTDCVDRDCRLGTEAICPTCALRHSA